MSIKHWMRAPIAVATLFASQLLLAGTPMAAEDKGLLIPAMTFLNKTTQTSTTLGKQHQKANILRMPLAKIQTW